MPTRQVASWKSDRLLVFGMKEIPSDASLCCAPAHLAPHLGAGRQRSLASGSPSDARLYWTHSHTVGWGI